MADLDDINVVGLAGRLYFLVLLPFILGAAGPWIVPNAAAEFASIFIIWSGSLLLFFSGYLGGLAASAERRFFLVYLLIAVVMAVTAVAALLLTLKLDWLWTGLGFLAVGYWVSLNVLGRTGYWVSSPPALKALHTRCVWIVLACHMLVAFNLMRASQ